MSKDYVDPDSSAHADMHAKWAAFARECGLDAYPCPHGDRYLYDSRTPDEEIWKKSEDMGFIDALWSALCRAKGREDLLGEEKDDGDDGAGVGHRIDGYDPDEYDTSRD